MYVCIFRHFIYPSVKIFNLFLGPAMKNGWLYTIETTEPSQRDHGPWLATAAAAAGRRQPAAGPPPPPLMGAEISDHIINQSICSIHLMISGISDAVI